MFGNPKFVAPEESAYSARGPFQEHVQLFKRNVPIRPGPKGRIISRNAAVILSSNVAPLGLRQSDVKGYEWKVSISVAAARKVFFPCEIVTNLQPTKAFPLGPG